MTRLRCWFDLRGCAARATSAALALLALLSGGCGSVPSAERAAPETVDWELLAGFEWQPAEVGAETGDPEIPSAIAALDGREIEIEAELAPITWGEDSALGYVLTRTPNACCLCVLPPFPEWIELRGGSTAELERRIFGRVRVRGVLAVGPERDAWGYVRSFYRLREPRLVEQDSSGG
ncbi:MAG: hypothetical protein JNM84_08535 [Planctomycetes bacterium]|nr:hypothetical protein [Planctomycetota bacterium]